MKEFSELLREAAADIWDDQHQHPFVQGIGDGSLDLERFKHWIRQDYLYLIDYSRLMALAAARSPDLTTMTRFASLLNETLHTEMSLHRQYAASFGISTEELERERPAPTTRAYTDFLLRTATIGDFGELVAGLLPCMWGYSEIGRQLATKPRPADARYAEWIDSYASDEFVTLVEWCRDLIDRLAEGVGPAERERMRNAFVTSSRWELAFWEMAWQLER